MKALLYPEYGKLTVSDLPPPKISDPSDVVLEVGACGICAGDAGMFKSRCSPGMPPLIMGHEFCGIVKETGKGVTRFNIGDYVISHSLVGCGKCLCCIDGEVNLCDGKEIFGMHRSGAFAQQIVVPEGCLYSIPAEVDFRAACMTEPVANAVHLVLMLMRTAASMDRVLIIGAGAGALLALQVVKRLTSAVVAMTDFDESRLLTAKALGADHVFRSEDTSPPAFVSTESAVVIGLTVSSNGLHSYDIILQDKSMLGTYAAGAYDLKIAVALIANRRIDVTSWVTYYPLEQGAQAFEDILAARHIKAVIVNKTNEISLKLKPS
jgi:threonine dehydrogenase-like Zn-dependent dehydrogenase